MSVTDSLDYEKVKTNILKAYELVPEAYRQKFRNYKKFDYQTYVEFSRNQEDHFDQWLRSKNINNFDNLRDLILIEQFKNCLYSELKTHIDEKEVKSLNEAAVLADSYTLTHKRYTKSLGHNDFRKNDKAYQPQHLATQNHSTKSTSQIQSESHFQPDINKNQNIGGKTSQIDTSKKKTGSTSCAYCKKPGHHISQCRKKAWNESHPLGFISENKTDSDTFNTFDTIKSRNKVMETYKPYLSEGSCSVDSTSKPIPIQILRDTGASQTLILEGTLPLSEKTAIGESALLEVVQMGAFNAPLHQINLKSKFISGPVTVGVSPTLPVKGIQMLLGNDLASGKDILIPIVSEKAQAFNTPDDDQDLYPACAVTRAMALKEKEKGDPDTNSDFTYNLMDTFFQKLNEKEKFKASSLSDKDKSTGELSKQRLTDEQRKDTELRDLYKITVNYEDIDNEQNAFTLKTMF